MRELITWDYTEKHRTKRASRGYKSTCPSCAGNDMWVTRGDGASGSGYCFECGTSYRIVKSLDDPIQQSTRTYITKPFDTHAIRETYKEAMSYYHSCISTEHEQFLLQRGITREAINFFKIGFCPPGTSKMYLTETAKEAGLVDNKQQPWLSNRVIFPYTADNEITDLRGRAIHGEEPRYKSLYHKSEQRGAIYPFNFDEALKRAHITKKLILTEGEIKAVVADRLGHAVMAFPGMLSFRRGLVTQPGIQMIVIFDSSPDTEDKIRVDRAIAKIADKLPVFSVVTLPLLSENKMDIDTFLLHKQGGPDRFQHFIDHAIEYKDYRRLRSF